jgi:trk system potassium uptake protein TrkH
MLRFLRGNLLDRYLRQDVLKESIDPDGTAVRGPHESLRSPFILFYGFGVLIAMGTILLWLPFSSQQRDFTLISTAFFTAASSVTLTGLTIVDTAKYWSVFGQVTIMVLFFMGGLGFMTLATFLLIAIRHRITLADRMLLKDALGERRLGSVVGLVRSVIVFALVVQLGGFLILYWRLHGILPPGEAAWQALFHSVSAFNSSGFSIAPVSLSLEASGEGFPILGMMTLIMIFGGIGVTVVWDILRHRQFSRLALDTRLVLTATLILWLLGSVVIFVSEYSNPDTLGPSSVVGKLSSAIFHSVSSRTAGFSTIDFGSTQQHTNFFMTGLMFIGGASGSTSGGIKVNTASLVFLAMLATVLGRSRVQVYRREIAAEQVQRAIAVVVLGVTLIFLVAFILTFTEGMAFLDVLFETVSAFGTVGLSTGITGDLSFLGKLIIVATMFLGRLGPLTFAMALSQHQERTTYRYAQEGVRIG